MNYFCLFFILTFLSCKTANQMQSVKVLGAEEIADDPSPNSTIYLSINGSICTGSLITMSDVLTASHCIEESEDYTAYYISKDGSKKRHTGNLVFYKKFLPQSDGHFFDIAVIRFSEPFPDHLTPVTLLADHKILPSAELHIQSGFGVSETGLGDLLSTTVNFKEYLNRPYHQHLLIYGNNPNKGGCAGDSGGPAFVKIDDKWYQAGVFSGYSENFNGVKDCLGGSNTYSFVGAYYGGPQKLDNLLS